MTHVQVAQPSSLKSSLESLRDGSVKAHWVSYYFDFSGDPEFQGGWSLALEFACAFLFGEVILQENTGTSIPQSFLRFQFPWKSRHLGFRSR